ncbi:SusD/RagB family nutrient-binding outer membrane lipoprotein [Pedobacter frigidisoli]|uniref:SusD/RagB family nutrient-binding outer membrane lipoprotein n=1 Tax=Pedobacter frigidisoli TaxID=2530455 RepID=A0A4R0P151_9SPHI|nr:SusD/RagB family nutrient-binding outer membrane lipoprotein [Pedobacter frigidisoli]TCD10474.1 SusD/RagB family nutrient-binding outer membrane lipoprotein [Pedobacter frigidisoli]
MKNIYKPLFYCLIGSFVLSSCTKFKDSINTDPNSPTKASGTQLIANAEQFLPGLSSSPYGVHYPQYLSNTSFPDNSRYVTTNFNFYGLYEGPLMNLQNVIDNTALDASEGPITNQIAVAKILKAYFMWHATDRWGPLPYSEAWKGSGNFTPKYDTQQAIYNSLFTLLDEANASITAGDIKNDIVYPGTGNVAKWKKLGNTIHMLMALRLSKVDPAKGTSEFNKALANGIMNANTDNLAYPHLAVTAQENYWYNSFTVLSRNWFAVSKPVVDFMLPLNDPRLPIFANKNTAGNYVGLDYGLSTTVTPGNYSLLGNAIRQQNSPVYLVTYAQALFGLAEAAKIGWIAGSDATAKTNYDLGIEQSVRQWNNNDISALAAYKLNASVVYNPATALQQIGNQRWVHLFMHGYEGWAEWRRTGFPTFLAPAPNNNGKQIPRREGYPTQEININSANYNAAVAAFPYGGSDNLDARVWWDKP